MNKIIGTAMMLCAFTQSPAFAACDYDAIVAEIDQSLAQAKSEPAGCAQDQAVSEAIMAGADILIGECSEDDRAKKKLEDLNEQVEAADTAVMKSCK
jgi:hypothetical protein